MVAVGASKTAATAVANLLVEADHRGHFSHGMNRLGNKISKQPKTQINPNRSQNSTSMM